MNETEKFFDNIASAWDSMENHTDEEKKSLIEKAGIKKGDLVLDIACGTGVITSLLHDYSSEEVTGIDLSGKMIEEAKTKYKNAAYARFIHKDVLSLEEKEKYDVAVIYNAYPHFKEVDKLVQKLSFILKNNGKFAILHSLSRAQLSLHHSGSASFVSREIEDVKKEAAHFEKYFDIITAEEDDHSFVIVGRKK